MSDPACWFSQYPVPHPVRGPGYHGLLVQQHPNVQRDSLAPSTAPDGLALRRFVRLSLAAIELTKSIQIR
jgi:hypothetical protein